ASTSAAGSYPKQGGFKKLPTHKDKWYQVDNINWYIKAPDKWTHFMGSYALTELTGEIVRDKALAGMITFGLGILKEMDDAYREGWSDRDLYMDFGGVASSLLLPDNWKLLAYYDDRQVMFKLSVIVD
ncbi:MAG: hypothetical protein AB1744_13025, partial [Candidatus Zixiibacteriota bacterium]